MSSHAPAFDLHLPSVGDSPVVFDSPHSGMDWPADFTPAAPRAAILTTWDAFVEELWGGAPAHGATLLSARFPRAYVDVNRARNDIDPALLDGPWPEPLATSDYSRRGMGLIRRLALPGVAMYSGPLTVAAVQSRLVRCYDPYRRALELRLDQLRGVFGTVWHVNCHSMKSRGNGMNTDAGRMRPDIVVSDRRGRTADPRFTAWVADWFTDRGFTVKVNEPYLGGHLVISQGRPEDGRHSVQIEINRALYLDEVSVTRSARFPDLCRTLSLFAKGVCDFARDAVESKS
ncbi:MAG: N-formylglutamate amidohydrolase [Opitutaceae bacterium]|nr:N-formylglutamate amidohydrolase [Opitutaceae bacterium]